MPSISIEAHKKIEDFIEIVVEKYLKKAEDKPKANSANPFVMALLRDFDPLIHRIHGLKTSLGSSMEKIAEVIAIDAWGYENVLRNQRVDVRLPQNVFQTIDSIINDLSNAKTLSDYYSEKNDILNACRNPSSQFENHTYEFDLILRNPTNGSRYFLEMKGPDPNTTEVPGAKKRLLVALAWGFTEYSTEKLDCHFAIYYNNVFPKPYRNPKVHYYFNPNGGILVHDKFWNFLGKDDSTFNDLLAIFENYGITNKKRIWDGFAKLIDIK
ncbi:TdeIII family type II restriction endonuclease [bacterium]|nr:TdeIII family type II restriction endonuclease [bacterium]